MYSPEKTESEQTLSDIIEKKGLPVTVEVTRTCTIRDEPVIKEGQLVTVLSKQWIHLMYGKNWENRTFRINIAKIKDEMLQLVEEYYVKDVNNMKDVTLKCKYVQLKTPLKYKFYEFEKCDKFIFNFTPENPDVIDLTSVRLGVRLTLPLVMVFDWNTFVFVKPGEKLSINDFVKRSTFRPSFAEFEKTTQGLPSGIVRIEELPIYETILAVTKCNETLIKYEFFPLHLAIPAIESDYLFLPKQLPLDKKSAEYLQKIQEIEFIMHFDIYEARFYGYVEYEDQFRVLISEMKPTSINRTLIRKSKSFSDFDTLNENSDIYEMRQQDSAKDKKKRSPNVFASFRSKIASPTREKSKSVLSKSPKNLLKEELTEEEEPKEKHFPKTKSSGACDLKSYKKTSPNGKQVTKLSSPCRDNIESVNELYGKLTIVRSAPQITSKQNPRSISPTDVQPLPSIRSAQFSEKDLRMRKKSTPVSMEASKPKINLANTRRAFSVSPTDVQNDLNNSSPKYEKPTSLNLVKSYSVELEVPLGARKRSFQNKQQNRQRAATPDAIFTNSDSGIDSPETRKSTDNLVQSCDFATIKRMFEQNNQVQKPFKNEKLDSRFRSSSESHIIESPMHEHEKKSPRPKSMFSGNNENFYESVNYADVKNAFRLSDPDKQKEVDSLRKIKSYDKHAVIAMLHELNMGKYESLFKAHQVDGALLTDLSEAGLIQMNMSQFEARKLYKFIHGWRPKLNSTLKNDYQDTRLWSVLDVHDLLLTIQQKDLAEFCIHNKIDGELLLELTEANLLKGITSLKLNEFELRKVYKFVHGWRPNSTNLSLNSNTSAMNWSIENTFNSLKQINLDRLGKFCLDNQVDGDLLIDLIDTGAIFKLADYYGISLIEVERKRLQREVRKNLDLKLQGYF